MPTDLDAQFWRACDILRRDDNTQGLLDYVEQISWLLFLKSFEDLEDTRADEAAYEGRPFDRVIDSYYRWSVWTGGRVERARTSQREAEAALRAAQKTLLSLETSDEPNPQELAAARAALRQAESAIENAAQAIDAERQLQHDALAPLFNSEDEDDRKMAEAIVAGLTGKTILRFLSDYLFPHLRELSGTPEREVVRQLFEETPSKMVKNGINLRDAINVIDTIDFHSQENLHTLSQLYEGLLVRLGREGGMSGELYTPRSIIRFIVQMVDPRIGETVFDPAGGSMGFQVEAYAHMLPQAKKASDLRILQKETFYGQEKKPLPYLIGVMNCVLHGIAVPHIVRKNSLSDDVRKITERDRHHVILTNPPFGGTENVEAIRENFRYPSSWTSILFLQYIMAKLRRDGRAGMVIDDTVLSKTNERAYIDTKKELLDEFNLYAIVSLPAGVFANVTASGPGPRTDLLFFDHLGPTHQVWYYEVRAVGFSLTRTQKPIAENDLPDCLAMWQKYNEWLHTPPDQRPLSPPLNGRCWVVSAEELVKRNYDLSARNPHRTNDFVHRPPSDLTADIADRQVRAAELIEELLELLASDSFSEVYPLVSMDTFLRHRKKFFTIDNATQYQLVTVQLHARGIKERQRLTGDQIKTKRQQRIRAGDLLVAEIDAKVGGYGIVPPELEGAIVSNHYYLYEVDTDIVDLKYLEYYLKSGYPEQDIKQFVKGALNYAAIRPYHFPQLRIPLPSKSEQQRIVYQLDKLSELREIHSAIQKESDGLMLSMLNKVYSPNALQEDS